MLLSVTGTGDGLLGQYYPGIDIDFATSTPTATRVDPTINFNWNSAGPIAALGNTNYSVRWTGEVQAQFTEPYTFYTDSDDGIQVILNGQTIISDYVLHSPTVDTSATINLVAGQSYTIEVDYFQNSGGAVASLSWSSPSTPEEIIPQSQLYSGLVPAAPVLAQPVAASSTQINLAWTESSGNETGFEIYRKVGANGTYSSLAVVAPTTTTYMDTGLDSDTEYYYEVQALNSSSSSNSPLSNEVSLTTPPPAAPTGLSTVRGNSQVTLSWTASDGALSYDVYRSLSPGGEGATSYASGINTTSFVDNETNNDTTYYYIVTAVDSVTQSAPPPKSPRRRRPRSRSRPYRPICAIRPWAK